MLLGKPLNASVLDMARSVHGVTGVKSNIGNLSLSIDESFVGGAAYIDGRYMVIPEAAIAITDWGDRRSDVTHDIVSGWDGRFFRLDDRLRRFPRPRRTSLEPVREQIESAESFVIQGGGLIRLGGSPMWTSKNRRRYDRSRLRYPSDVTDEEWALVEPLIPPAKRGGNRRHVVVREVINGLMYILSTGCQWRAIPTDLPPRSTLYDYFDLWSWDGTLDRIHDALYAQCREAASREASPTAAIIDSQSVKSAEKGGLRLIRRATMRARRSRARSGTSSSIRRAC